MEKTFINCSSVASKVQTYRKENHCVAKSWFGSANDCAMGTIPTVTTMEVDVMASDFIEHCMGTPTVLRKVLEQFSNRELVTLSLVNKQWNYEARSVLKSRGDVTARIRSRAVNPCQSLVAFAVDLRNMRVVPFSGVHVLLSHDVDIACQSWLHDSMDPSYNVILDRLPWRHLAVTFKDTVYNCKDCQVLKYVKKILEDLQEVLQELSITFYWEEKKEMHQQVFQSCRFPRLRTLKIDADSRDESLTDFLKALVSRCPNLRVLNFRDDIQFQENVLKGSPAVLVPTFEFDPLNERVCESLISSLRAQGTLVLSHRNCKFNEDLLIRDIPMVLQASCTSLKTLKIDLLFIVPLMCYGICLENVRELEIWMPKDALESVPFHILTLVKSFDFTRVFPKLQKVMIVSNCHIYLTPGQISGFVEQENALLTNASLDGAVNIKHITLGELISDSALPFWTQMFPHVEKLSVNTGIEDLSQFPFTLLWEKFATIEELNAKTFLSDLSMTANMDSVFCGIFPEEAAELMGRDDKYLRAVNIVPVMPSITCVKSLRTFTLDFTVPVYSKQPPEIKSHPMFLFSKVTALIGFARCPALAVKFESDSYSAEALGHMKKFVSFVNKPPLDRTPWI